MGEIAINGTTFQEVAANGKTVQEMWLNGSQIYAAGDFKFREVSKNRYQS